VTRRLITFGLFIAMGVTWLVDSSWGYSVAPKGNGHATAVPVTSSALYQLKPRYYSADLKRFATADPVGLQGGLNLYVYGSDNPLAFLDPLGLCDSLSWGQGGGNSSRYGPVLGSPNDPDYDPDALAANNLFSGLGAANLNNGDMARDLTITVITTVAGEAVFGPSISAVRKFLGFGAADGAPKGISKGVQLVGDIVGPNAKATLNTSGDLVIQSQDGLTIVRFDINKTGPHTSPHAHVEFFEQVGNTKVPIQKSGPIYPGL
jgi:RHS repeat-associated protein